MAEVVSHKFPLEQINEAFEFAEWHGREGGTAASRVALKIRFRERGQSCQIGKVTIFDKPGVPFEIGEFPTPEVETGRACSSRTRMR